MLHLKYDVIAEMPRLYKESIYRIFIADKRVATGKDWNNVFLQVYPEKKEFKTYDEWRDFWTKKYTMKVHIEATFPGATSMKEKAMWSYRKDLWFTAPAGTYFIGDLCYALHDNIYDGVFGGEAYASGLYQKGTSFFLVDATWGGDGTYTDNHKREYLVDAGIIGICSEDLINKENTSLDGGHIITFKNPVQILFDHGKFNFHDFTSGEGLTIQT